MPGEFNETPNKFYENHFISFREITCWKAHRKEEIKKEKIKIIEESKTQAHRHDEEKGHSYNLYFDKAQICTEINSPYFIV
jgi:hypothetical protein